MGSQELDIFELTRQGTESLKYFFKITSNSKIITVTMFLRSLLVLSLIIYTIDAGMLMGSAGRKLGLNRNRGGWNSDRRAKNLGGLTVMDDNDGPNPYISRGSGPKPCVGVCQYLKMMNAKQQSKRSFYNGINSLEDYDHYDYTPLFY